MTKEEPEIIKQGYQPIHSKNAGVIPPNTGSHVRMKENEYTWKDLDKAWWEGFDNAKNKMEKRIADLEKENAELKTKVTALENANRAMVKELDDMTSGGVSVLKNIVRSKEQLTKAKEYALENYENCLYDDFPYVNDSRAREQSFRDGAEFGYNKANEWHKYSERPKEKINALCLDTEQNSLILGFYDLEADEWLRYGGYETIHIDLWKEIVLPELPKEN